MIVSTYKKRVKNVKYNFKLPENEAEIIFQK